MPIIYLGSSLMLKRTECHQWVDLGPWNDHFNCRGRAFALIPVGTFNHSMAYPLNAKLIRHSFGGHTKTTMFESHKPSRTERNSGPQITIRRGLREAQHGSTTLCIEEPNSITHSRLLRKLGTLAERAQYAQNMVSRRLRE